MSWYKFVVLSLIMKLVTYSWCFLFSPSIQVDVLPKFGMDNVFVTFPLSPSIMSRWSTFDYELVQLLVVTSNYELVTFYLWNDISLFVPATNHELVVNLWNHFRSWVCGVLSILSLHIWYSLFSPSILSRWGTRYHELVQVYGVTFNRELVTCSSYFLSSPSILSWWSTRNLWAGTGYGVTLIVNR